MQPSEELSSFVYRQDQIIRKTTPHIRHTRLMPRRNATSNRLEVSVCRSSFLNDDQVWTICSEHFDVYSPAPAIGRGVGKAEVVFAADLEFDADGIPYPEHANIIGWLDVPGTPDGELKHYWMDLAQKMAPSFVFSSRHGAPT